MPDGNLDFRKTRLSRGRQVRQRLDPLRCGHRIGLNRTGPDLPRGVGRLVAHEVDLATDQIRERGPGAVIRDLGQVDADRLLDQQPAQLGASPGVGEGERVCVALDVGDQLLQRRRWEVLTGDDRHRYIGDQTYRLEIHERLVGQVRVERGRRRHGDVVDEHLVAIGLGLGNLPGSDSATSARDILDHDLLAELGAHGLRDQPGDGVGRSTGRVGHHEGDLTIRVRRWCGVSPPACGEMGDC